MPIVLDWGSGNLKVGDAGLNQPQHIVKTCLYISNSNSKDYFVGDEAVSRAENNPIEGYSLKYPLEYGICTNWDQMELIWNHIFYSGLAVDLKSERFMLTEVPLNAKANRERVTQMMFETFEFSCFYISIQATLALYASGRTTGVVVDSGYGITHTVPIYEGYALPHGIRTLYIAGTDITQVLRNKLSNRGINLTYYQVEKIKEAVCFIPVSEKEKNLTKEVSFCVNPGKSITIKPEERYEPCEILFDPSLIGKKSDNLSKLLNSTIRSGEVDIRGDFVENIVVTGGTTMFPGFVERVKNDVVEEQYQSYKSKVKVIAPPERMHSVWIGGSILASLSTFSQMWITRGNYDDSGPSIVHRKCF